MDFQSRNRHRNLINGSASAPPAKDFIVAIDIGHTKNRGGATSARGVSEYVFNERLSRELFNSLQAAHQFRSLLINPGGGDIGLVKRAQVANQRNADLFIAIHHDSVKDSFLKEWVFGGKAESIATTFTVSRFFSRARTWRRMRAKSSQWNSAKR